MEAFDTLAELYQDAHAENPHENAAVAALAARLAPGSRVLDLGCGTGVPTARVLTDAGHTVTGVDVAGKMLDLARAQVPQATFVQGDMRTLGFGPGSFEAVTAYFSLLMLSRDDMGAMFDRIAGWLVPGGLLSFSLVEFDGDTVPVEFMGASFTTSGYLGDALGAVVASHGFEVLDLHAAEHVPPVGPPEPQLYCLARTAPA